MVLITPSIPNYKSKHLKFDKKYKKIQRFK